MEAKLLAPMRVKVWVAAVSALALVIGAVAAPRQARSAISVSPEHAAPLLDQQVQARQEVQPFQGVHETAQRVRTYSVEFAGSDASPQPRVRNDFLNVAGSAAVRGAGVVVRETLVLTHVHALPRADALQVRLADNATRDARVIAYEPSTGLVLLRTSQPAPSAPLAATLPATGALLVGAGRIAGRDIVVPAFITGVEAEHLTVGTVSTPPIAGLPYYTDDGAAVAVGAGDQTGRAYFVGDAVERLLARAAAGEQWPSIGVSLEAGDAGVIAAGLVAGGPAERGGIAAGDLILAVGDVKIASVDDFTRAIAAAAIGAPVSLRVLRNKRVREMAVVPAPAHEVAILAR